MRAYDHKKCELEVLPLGNAYHYDQLNRIKHSLSFTNLDTASNTWLNNGASTAKLYRNIFTYDANGNINTQMKYDSIGVVTDSLVYNYEKISGKMRRNRLYHVNDLTSTPGLAGDIEDQGTFVSGATINTANNYRYDEIGNLIYDAQEQIDTIRWNVYGKIKAIARSSGSSKDNLYFDYDASGNRIAKHNYTQAGVWKKSTYYIRDAQGNVMSVYNKTSVASVLSYELNEQHLYGSSRLGMVNKNDEMIGAVASNDTTKSYLGLKQYELSNHLGNVLSVISDKKIAIATSGAGSTTIDHYTADQRTANDYYPFGSPLPGRRFNLPTVTTATIYTETFTSGTGGFLNTIGGVTYAALTNVSSSLRVAPGTAATNQATAKAFTTVPGRTYKVSYSMGMNAAQATAGGVKSCVNYAFQISPTIHAGVVVTTTAAATYTFEFKATGSTAFLQFQRVNSSTVTTRFFAVDNIVITETTPIAQYNYAFEGQEKVDDVSGAGNVYSFEYRMQDSRLGRFFSVDPVSHNYPWNSTYAFAENRPIDGIDLEGKEWENIKSKFQNPGQLAIKLPNVDRAQVQRYSTTVQNPQKSFSEFKTDFTSHPQNFLSNSQAVFHAPVDGKGESSQFKVGSYIKIDIGPPGSFASGYVKVVALETKGNKMYATFATIEGHLEKGIIKFTITEAKDGKITFDITSISEVDQGAAKTFATSYSRKKQAESWKEVLDNVNKYTGGKETDRKAEVVNAKTTDAAPATTYATTPEAPAIPAPTPADDTKAKTDGK